MSPVVAISPFVELSSLVSVSMPRSVYVPLILTNMNLPIIIRQKGKPIVMLFGVIFLQSHLSLRMRNFLGPLICASFLRGPQMFLSMGTRSLPCCETAT